MKGVRETLDQTTLASSLFSAPDSPLALEREQREELIRSEARIERRGIVSVGGKMSKTSKNAACSYGECSTRVTTSSSVADDLPIVIVRMTDRSSTMTKRVARRVSIVHSSPTI